MSLRGRLQVQSARRVLALAVFAAGLLIGGVPATLPVVFFRAGIRVGGPVDIRVIAPALMTATAALAPMMFVFVACRRTAVRSLSVSTIAAISLIVGIGGRYAGAILGTILVGRRIPTIVMLATPADITVGGADPGILLMVLIGVLAAGLWPLVGAFAGVGLAGMTGTVTETSR